MAKTKAKKPGKGKKRAAGMQKKSSVPQRRPAMPRAPRANEKALYRKLLFDPCNAELVIPPYLGSEQGYLVRTRDIVVPFYKPGSTVTGTTGDFAVQWSPGNLSLSSTTKNYGLVSGGNTPGATITLTPGSKSESSAQFNFINSANTPASSYRVVACCLKWIPTGPPLSRQGLVSMLSLPSYFAAFSGSPTGTGVVNCVDIESACPFPVSNANGDVNMFECVWLPGTKDQEYGAFEDNMLEAGYGTLICGLSGVDQTISGTGTASYSVPNGRFEITTVFQWAPRVNGGVTSTLQTPPKHTVNDVLSEVKDLGKAVYTGLTKTEHGAETLVKLLAHAL